MNTFLNLSSTPSLSAFAINILTHLNFFKSSVKYDDNDIIFFFTATLLIFIGACFVKKFFYWAWYKKPYYIFPLLNVRGITNIAMIIAMNASLIFTVSWLSSGVLGTILQIYPGSRMMIENTLVMIGGIIFGPVIGLFIGGVTDLLTVILTSSLMNYGYWLTAIMNGFIGGIINILIKGNDKRGIKSLLITTVLVVATMSGFWMFMEHNTPETSLVVNIFSNQISVNKFLILSILVLIAFITWFLCFANTMTKWMSNSEDDKTTSKVVLFFRNYGLFFYILAIKYIAYIFIDVMALPLFDIKISTLPYEQFLMMRLFFMIPNILLTSVIIYKIYKLHQKNNYMDPLAVIEDTPNKTNSLNIKDEFQNRLCH